MKNKFYTFLLAFILSAMSFSAQNSTYSPYSRYGLGEISPNTFAHNLGMGGANIAWQPDSTIESKFGAGCFFINSGNPAAYPYIRHATLEVGGKYQYTNLKTTTADIRKWNVNFGYGALGFPVRGNGGAVLGIMPYTHVGYDTRSEIQESAGNITYLNSGQGDLNKAFLGYGVMPFNQRLVRFKKKFSLIERADSSNVITRTYIHTKDTSTISDFSYKTREVISKLLSDFSIGANVNYIFGNIDQTARVVYPNSLLYNNSYRLRTLTMGDFTGNFGIQTAYTIDHVKGKNGSRRILKEKVKFTFGYFMTLNNPMRVTYDAAVYNYILNSSGQEIIRDTVLYNANQKSTITLPLEQGFGIGFKKGERLNIVSDFAITGWRNFKFIEQSNALEDNFRIAIGANYIPEKGAAGAGAYFRKINYRIGLNYNTGYVQIKNSVINNYGITAGLGLPVGIGQNSSMVNVAVQYGQLGTLTNNLVRENYWRINFGFTFSDRWFQKFKYD